MVQKRPFDEEELNEVPLKQPRQIELNNQLVSALEFPSEPVVEIRHTEGEGDNSSAKIEPEGDEKLDIGYSTELSVCASKDAETNVPGSFPSSSLFTGSMSEDDIRSEAPFYIMLSPDQNFEHQSRTIVRPGEIYSFLLDHSPQKLIPVGENFQADIPECLEISSCTEHKGEMLTQSLDYDEGRLAGTCLVPLSDSEQSADTGAVGVGRTGCSCGDEGSIRCTQQHIVEAKEKLRGTFGSKTFAELGFYNVGEVVAEKWSEDEEKLFCEVIISNPASLGKNYWNHLTVAFPSRSKKEIVSYYFNVFMLRRRAEQNRYAQLGIDSDDDEWLGTEDSSDNEVQHGEDDDFMAESPTEPDHNNEEFAQNAPVDCRAVDFGSDGVNEREECTSLNPSDGNFSYSIGFCNAQQGSCTSGDVEVGSQVNKWKADGHKHQTCHLNGTNGINDHELGLEASNSRDWELGYLTCPRNEIELLPTCNVIEEVFGVGS